MKLDFKETSKELPVYGEPVLIIINGVLQYITYFRDGDDHVPDWFEPYFFDHDDELKILWNKVEKWAYLP